MVSKKKKGTNIETKLLKVVYITRPKVFYVGPPYSILKLTLLNVCGLPFNRSNPKNLCWLSNDPIATWIGDNKDHSLAPTNLMQREPLPRE